MINLEVYKMAIRTMEQVKKAIKEIDSIIEEKKEEWALKNLLINDQIQKGEKTNELLRKGINKWYDLFNNRQLFANTSLLESISEIKKEILKKIVDIDLAKAVILMLQIGFDRCVDYNSVITLWDSTRLKVGHTFVGHDFGFKWRYGEIDLIRKGYRWFIEDLLKVFNEIIDLTNEKTSNININLMNAMKLENFEDNSIDLIVVDPPYYNNVIYSELSDYFYVWMKRNLSDLYPDVFRAELADRDNEAVANTSRFEGLGKNKKKLASEDYESKMEKIFSELNRILKIHGVMTIMFTHKATDAWDTLTMAIMKAGFEITASWPVATESPISANIKDKNAVKTTILLVCRKRLGENKEVWWEDEVLPSLKKIAYKKGKEFKRMGIDGVDLFIAAFGPTLQEFSKNYPVKNIEGEELRAEEALKITREVISSIIFNDIMKDTNLRLDLHSKFYILAWKIYGARKFPFDEARNLALSLGINIDELKSERIIKKTSGDIQLISPKDREKNGSINIDNPKDNGFLINAVHIAILAYEEGGKELYEKVIEKLRRNTDKTFRLYMETLFNILPDVKDLAKNLPEKKILGEILERVRSLGMFDYDDQFKMVTYDSADNFTESGIPTPNSDDIYELNPTETGSLSANTRAYSEHPMAEGSFWVKKAPASQIVTNFTIGRVTALSSFFTNRVQEAFDNLEKLWKERTLVTIITIMKVYENVAITNIIIPRNALSGSSLSALISFQQMNIVKLKTVDIDVSVKQKAMKTAIQKQSAPPVEVAETITYEPSTLKFVSNISTETNLPGR